MRNLAVPVLAVGAIFAAISPAQDRIVTQADCSYSVQPSEYRQRERRARHDVFARMAQASSALPRTGAHVMANSFAVPAAEIPVRNLVDQEIFARLSQEGIPAAPLSSDEVFLRRVMLDLNGRAPSPQEVREFTASSSPDKREELVNRLLFTPEFVAKWTMWLGDLLQNSQAAQNINQNLEGRNRMHEWMVASIDSQKSLRDIVTEALIATGNNFDRNVGQVNFIVRGFTPMGPQEDHYDGTLAKTASAFLGLSHYDCLLCHDGSPRLRSVSAWANTVTRADAQKMAAFFSRVIWRSGNNPNDPYYTNSLVISDNASPNKFYALTSTSGNRPSRVTPNPADPTRNLASYSPVYRDGRVPGSGPWRDQFAQFLISDPMFARNLANRLWKAMFTTALVEPVDSLDPLRLDPANPPPEPWTYQTPHVVLLDRLARALQDSDYNLREFLRLLATSSAYQLSSSYDGDWNIERVPFFPRHYARRLEGEEVHDILVRGSGVLPRYTIGGWAEPVSYAMQFPDTLEPRSNGAVAGFLNAFQRGNRDNVPRSQTGSILMRLNLMNSTVVTDKIRMSSSPVLQAIGRLPSDEAVVEELFLTFLSRVPVEAERAVGLKRMAEAANAAQRNTAIEDLAWVLANKVEFVYSY